MGAERQRAAQQDNNERLSVSHYEWQYLSRDNNAQLHAEEWAQNNNERVSVSHYEWQYLSRDNNAQLHAEEWAQNNNERV